MNVSVYGHHKLDEAKIFAFVSMIYIRGLNESEQCKQTFPAHLSD